MYLTLIVINIIGIGICTTFSIIIIAIYTTTLLHLHIRLTFLLSRRTRLVFLFPRSLRVSRWTSLHLTFLSPNSVEGSSSMLSLLSLLLFSASPRVPVSPVLLSRVPPWVLMSGGQVS
ncbi:hypothetical protein XENORESO_021003 [Xenotaenia resolanae]|uniref:Uncharacterized protein n=1 Tax=Xenotaenia resolanae TaxID=208358 RepID=A0ABV0VTW0_9TELE